MNYIVSSKQCSDANDALSITLHLLHQEATKNHILGKPKAPASYYMHFSAPPADPLSAGFRNVLTIPIRIGSLCLIAFISRPFSKLLGDGNKKGICETIQACKEHISCRQICQSHAITLTVQLTMQTPWVSNINIHKYQSNSWYHACMYGILQGLCAAVYLTAR